MRQRRSFDEFQYLHFERLDGHVLKVTIDRPDNWLNAALTLP